MAYKEITELSGCLKESGDSLKGDLKTPLFEEEVD